MTEKQNFWDTLRERQLDRRLIYIVMFILLLIPTVSPLGLPMPISSMTRNSYEAIEAVPSGSTVLIAVQTSVGLWPK